MSGLGNPGATRHFPRIRILAAVLALGSSFALAADVAPTSAETVHPLMMRDLAGAGGKAVSMLTVTYPPGGSSPPHRHDAQVFVYVLEGEMTMQLKGAAAVTLRTGQTFYEGPDDIHQVSANASKIAPARILVFMIKDKATPASPDVADQTAP